MRCLHRGRQALAALADVLEHESDAVTVAHARQAASQLPNLDHCRDQALPKTRDAPLSDATTLALAAVTALRSVGKHAEAEARLDAVLANSSSPRARARGLLERSRIRWLNNDYPGARQALRDAALLAADLGDDVFLAQIRVALAEDASTEQLPEAEVRALIEAARVDVRRAGNPSELQFGVAVAEGNFHYTNRRYEQSLAAFRNAVALATELPGAPAATARARLAMALQNAGQHDEALRTAEAAIEVGRRMLGDDNLALSRILGNVAGVRERAGDHAGARDLLAQVVAIREARLGKDHPATAGALVELAYMDAVLGDFRASAETADRALAILVATQEPHGLQATNARMAVGHARYKLGEYEAARAAYGQALHDVEERAGSDAPATSTYHYALGQVAFAQGRHDDALAAYERSMPADGGNSRATMAALFGIGRTQMAMDRVDAVATLRRAVAMANEILGNPSQIAELRFALARALYQFDQQEEALTIAHEAVAAMTRDVNGTVIDEARAWLAERAPP
ncbi:MAG: tetratricopeptide repeat protein [Myxococcota bacterium]